MNTDNKQVQLPHLIEAIIIEWCWRLKYLNRQLYHKSQSIRLDLVCWRWHRTCSIMYNKWLGVSFRTDNNDIEEYILKYQNKYSLFRGFKSITVSCGDSTTASHYDVLFGAETTLEREQRLEKQAKCTKSYLKYCTVLLDQDNTPLPPPSNNLILNQILSTVTSIIIGNRNEDHKEKYNAMVVETFKRMVQEHQLNTNESPLSIQINGNAGVNLQAYHRDLIGMLKILHPICDKVESVTQFHATQSLEFRTIFPNTKSISLSLMPGRTDIVQNLPSTIEHLKLRKELPTEGNGEYIYQHLAMYKKLKTINLLITGAPINFKSLDTLLDNIGNRVEDLYGCKLNVESIEKLNLLSTLLTKNSSVKKWFIIFALEKDVIESMNSVSLPFTNTSKLNLTFKTNTKESIMGNFISNQLVIPSGNNLTKLSISVAIQSGWKNKKFGSKILTLLTPGTSKIKKLSILLDNQNRSTIFQPTPKYPLKFIKQVVDIMTGSSNQPSSNLLLFQLTVPNTFSKIPKPGDIHVPIDSIDLTVDAILRRSKTTIKKLYK